MSFEPINSFERLIADAKLNDQDEVDLISGFVAADIAVPSGAEVFGDWRGFQPVLFDKAGTKMVACFSDLQRIGEISKIAPYCLTTNGLQFLKRIPSGYGVVINPGQTFGFDISPSGLREILADFS